MSDLRVLQDLGDELELAAQRDFAATRRKASRTRWRRRPLVIAGVVTLLLAIAGVAIAIIGDGVVYVGPATDITATGDLTLVVQDSNLGPCLQVHSKGTMSGGCGADLSRPLSVGVGSLDGTSFASGWAPPGTVEVVMTFSGGETLSVTALQLVEGYEVLFFLAAPAPSPGSEPSLPIEVTAYDAAGNELATVTHSNN